MKSGCLIGDGVVLGPGARVERFERLGRRIKDEEKTGEEEDDEVEEMEAIEACRWFFSMWMTGTDFIPCYRPKDYCRNFKSRERVECPRMAPGTLGRRRGGGRGGRKLQESKIHANKRQCVRPRRLGRRLYIELLRRVRRRRRVIHGLHHPLDILTIFPVQQKTPSFPLRNARLRISRRSHPISPARVCGGAFGGQRRGGAQDAADGEQRPAFARARVGRGCDCGCYSDSSAGRRSWEAERGDCESREEVGRVDQ